MPDHREQRADGISPGVRQTTRTRLVTARLPMVNVPRITRNDLPDLRARPILGGVVSVIVPAHNEEAVIARLLSLLAIDEDQPPSKHTLGVLVVCNGCTDRTSEIARAASGVTVIETPTPSKAAALRLGDEHARWFPRLYVDADVELDAASAQELVKAFQEPGVMAASPTRTISRRGMHRMVSWYYDVWEALPAVQEGLFGRGVIAVSAEGYERIRALPHLMSDDMAMSAAFETSERRVVPGATVVVHPAQNLERPPAPAHPCRRGGPAGVRAPPTGSPGRPEAQQHLRTDSRTTRADLVSVVRRRPSLALKMPVFLAVAVLARRRAACPSPPRTTHLVEGREQPHHRVTAVQRHRTARRAASTTRPAPRRSCRGRAGGSGCWRSATPSPAGPRADVPHRPAPGEPP